MKPMEKQNISDLSINHSRTKMNNEEEKVCAWRHGPAAFWYEMLGVDDDGSNLDYGFKLKDKVDYFLCLNFIYNNMMSKPLPLCG